MNRAELLVRLENADQNQIKTIGLTPDGLITIESWRVTKARAQSGLERRTVGSGVYAPMEPIEALVKAVVDECNGYQIQTVIDGRSKDVGSLTNFVTYTSAIDEAQFKKAKETFALDASLDQDVRSARVGDSLILFMANGNGVIWLTPSRMNACFDCTTDQEAMTLLGTITMTLFSSASVPGVSGGGLTDLRQCINPKLLSEPMQELGGRAKLFAIQMKFTKQLAAVW